MKITKKVVNGCIEIEIENAPVYPKKARFTGPGFSYHDQENMDFRNWSKVDTISIGDDFSYSCGRMRGMRKTDSASWIAECMEKDHGKWMKSYDNFIKQNTESLEVMTKAQVLDKLCSEDKLCYRDKNGKFQTLNI